MSELGLGISSRIIPSLVKLSRRLLLIKGPLWHRFKGPLSSCQLDRERKDPTNHVVVYLGAPNHPLVQPLPPIKPEVGLFQWLRDFSPINMGGGSLYHNFPSDVKLFLLHRWSYLYSSRDLVSRRARGGGSGGSSKTPKSQPPAPASSGHRPETNRKATYSRTTSDGITDRTKSLEEPPVSQGRVQK